MGESFELLMLQLNSCLSPNGKEEEMCLEMKHSLDFGGTVVKNRAKCFSVPCYPLYEILLAIGNPTIDYFSLDVEGAEFGILKSIPWDKVDIKGACTNY